MEPVATYVQDAKPSAIFIFKNTWNPKKLHIGAIMIRFLRCSRFRFAIQMSLILKGPVKIQALKN